MLTICAHTSTVTVCAHDLRSRSVLTIYGRDLRSRSTVTIDDDGLRSRSTVTVCALSMVTICAHDLALTIYGHGLRSRRSTLRVCAMVTVCGQDLRSRSALALAYTPIRTYMYEYTPQVNVRLDYVFNISSYNRVNTIHAL